MIQMLRDVFHCRSSCSTSELSRFENTTVGKSQAERAWLVAGIANAGQGRDLGKRRIERAKQDKEVVAQLLGQFRKAQHGL